MTAVRHTGIVVADLDHALSFWCGILGFRVERQMEEAGPSSGMTCDLVAPVADAK